jgi:hypothetical protein
LSEARTVVILGSSIEESTRVIKVSELSEDDVQTLDAVGAFGEDSNPPKDLRGVSLETGVRGESVILGFYGDFHDTEPGEKKIYSTESDGSAVAAFIKLLTDGTQEFNGSGNFLTKFNELETAFNTLKADYDNLVTLYNAHIHTTTATVGATAVPGEIAPTTSSGSSSTADISGAKAENLKTN